MRIFYAANHEYLPGNYLWHNNLYLPLVDLGYEVIPFEYDLTPHIRNADPSAPPQRAFIEEHRPKLEQALLRQIEEVHRKQRIDVLFSYFYGAFCRPEVIREIRAMGICTINWYCNASYQFHLVQEVAPAYDYCLVPEKFRLDDYRRVGANPIYCQEAANPNICKPYQLSREFDVTFVGQKYGDRPEYIRFLLDAGVDVRVWGLGWQPQPQVGTASLRRLLRRLKKLNSADCWRVAAWKARRLIAPTSPATEMITIPPESCGPPLSDEELVKMYSRSKVSLGFSSCGETHHNVERILQVRLRDFEAPMSGAFYMVEYMEELEEFFEIGKEIVCYHDKVDLADKVKYYLKHDAMRERIRKAGHARALRDHTWQCRFENVFQTIGFAKAASPTVS